MKRPSRLTGLTAVVVVPLLLAACGDDDTAGTAAESSSPATASADSSFPVTVESDGQPVEIPEAPEQIVSLSPTATEMLFAIGAGDQVVAADEYSYYPPEAPTTDLSGYQPNAEAIIGYDPDLVVAENDPGELVSSLDQVGIPTLINTSAATIEDSYAQIERLGVATGHVGEAAELVAQMKADIDELTADIPADAEPITYFHELDPNLYTVTGETFVGEVYAMAGMVSIADDAPEASGPYPQLSPEYVVKADPDVIFYADSADSGVTAESIAQRPGWDQLTAVQEGRVIEIDKDIASRWGPRVVDFLRALTDARADLVSASS
ncbi:ABC transporter substrate-binding protein [Haloactinopolyspora sp.]|uniref:ABC transporter substrate-binding protein n=1 Tax=Haloactinopolyspora sp. TaxID=1966353 RepID=UPI00262555E2|nr:ABC transporter substrate-binding protein [Haloactinopolyspora sp.]